MLLDIAVHLDYDLPGPTDLLMQIEPAVTPDQELPSESLLTTPVSQFTRIPAEENLGQRIWMHAENRLVCDYTARVRPTRGAEDLSALPQVAPHRMPGDVVRYLMPSRYCPSDEFQAFIAAEFGQLTGGALIVALRDWINSAFSYVPGVSNAQTTALDTFVQRQGICRDFAHVLITLARAATIPARFASVYAPRVTPPDFHAVAEVYLDDRWHLVDPSGMATADEMALVGVGPDAAGVAFLTSFGPMLMNAQWVSVSRVDDDG